MNGRTSRTSTGSRHSCLRAVLATEADRALAKDLVAEAFARAAGGGGRGPR
ncbi:hypothetical protein [Dactylosporangium sp. CS-033363]|uniref:hypothetical protein n=1 Tax=Dactylosporangium sp. CS-033363 TaxID=3239935 RepID=UPI003D91A5CF